MQAFEERKTGGPEENLSEQRREPTNSTHIWRRVLKSNPDHIGGRRLLSPLGHGMARVHALCGLSLLGLYSALRGLSQGTPVSDLANAMSLGTLFLLFIVCFYRFMKSTAISLGTRHWPNGVYFFQLAKGRLLTRWLFTSTGEELL